MYGRNEYILFIKCITSHVYDSSESNQQLKMQDGVQNIYCTICHIMNKHNPTTGEQVAKGNFLTI